MKRALFIVAGITGAALAVKLWQTPERKRFTDSLFERNAEGDFTEPVTLPISKDYALMKGIIKC